MKCIMHNLTLEVKRVSNENAERLVAKNDYKYVPKSEWKALRVPLNVVVEPKEETKSKKHKENK